MRACFMSGLQEGLIFEYCRKLKNGNLTHPSPDHHLVLLETWAEQAGVRLPRVKESRGSSRTVLRADQRQLSRLATDSAHTASKALSAAAPWTAQKSRACSPQGPTERSRLGVRLSGQDSHAALLCGLCDLGCVLREWG